MHCCVHSSNQNANERLKITDWTPEHNSVARSYKSSPGTQAHCLLLELHHLQRVRQEMRGLFTLCTQVAPWSRSGDGSELGWNEQRWDWENHLNMCPFCFLVTSGRCHLSSPLRYPSVCTINHCQKDQLSRKLTPMPGHPA